ncbi:longitudinals lacking protein-like [Ixodes scapularis]|uniref:longitudinals lacking protein-like n=1 Tax=Ixodes scapularis TaxID=6945 RepID=UPI001C3902EA|nr:longitudinals lacking protein-like [Ixodes scapularis]
MEPAQRLFCLKWSKPESGVFSSLLSNESSMDVTLVCADRALKAHRMVLSAGSAFFQRLLMQSPSREPTLVLADVRFAQLRPVLEFMYCGEVTVYEHELPELLKVADALEIRGLADATARSGSDPALPDAASPC